MPTITSLARYFLRLGAAGFGGPIALVGYMHRNLVETRGWITEEEYREGLALAQLSPGPLAAQLCFYLGYIRGGVTGAAVSGLAFVLPSFAIVLGLGWAYVHYGGLPWMQAVFYGVGGRGYRNHHPKRLRPYPEDSGQGSSPVGHLSRRR